MRTSPKDTITIVAAGVTLYEALKAHTELDKQGVLVRIIDKDIEYHTSGFEPGHHIIHAPLDEDDQCEFKCVSCSFAGHWEALIGGASLRKKFGPRPHETLDEKTLNRIARFTAYGIYNTLLFWPSDCACLLYTSRCV